MTFGNVPATAKCHPWLSTSGRDLGLEGSDLCRVFSARTPWSGQLGGRSVFWRWVWGPETTSLAEAQSSQGICDRSRQAPGGPRDMWQARRAGSPRSLAPHPDLPRSSRLPPPRCASGPSPVTWGQCRTRLRECLWAYGRDSPVTPAVLEHRKWRPLLSRPQLLLSRPSQLLDGAGALSFTSPPVHRLRWRSRSEHFVPKQCCGFLESSSR